MPNYSNGRRVRGIARSDFASYEDFIEAVERRERRSAVKKCRFCRKILRQEHIEWKSPTLIHIYVCNNCDYILQFFKRAYNSGYDQIIKRIWSYFWDYRNNISIGKRTKVK